MERCHSERDRKILLMFVKQIFEDFEHLENRKESNLNKKDLLLQAGS